MFRTIERSEDWAITLFQSAMQKTSYYPFGMTLQQQNFGGLLIQPNKLLYNSKELNDDELAGSRLDWYDYGARFYDPQLGRWHVVDPLADEPEQADRSPYAYAWNTPIRLIDPDGQFPIIPIIWAAYEIGSAIYDGYQAYKTVSDKNATSGEKAAAVGGVLLSAVLPGGGYGTAAKTTVKAVDKAMDAKKVVTKADDVAEGVIYKRVDKTGKQKDYVGQAKSEKRYDARQKEHKKANPEADYEFTQIDKGKPGKDLNQKEQKHLDNMGGPTNKSNPNGGTSNKKNVIKKQ